MSDSSSHQQTNGALPESEERFGVLAERVQAEVELRGDLEQRVQRRTAELERANKALMAEIARRERG